MREVVSLTVVFFLLVFFSPAVRSEGQDRNKGVSILAENPSVKRVISKGQVDIVDPMEAIRQPPHSTYNSFGRRDPFLSFVKPSAEVTKGMPPLQRINVSQLKLIGVALGAGGYGAMIQTPDGKSYPVKRGVRIGTNDGRIKEIGPKEVIIEEPYLNIFGRSDFKQVIIKLYTKKEGIE